MHGDDATVRVDLSRPAGADTGVVVDSADCSNASAAPQIALICAKTADIAAVSSSSAALYSTQNGNVVLFGLQTSSGRPGAVQSYTNTADARAFIAANVYGLTDSSEDGVDANVIVPDDVVAASLVYPLAYLSYGMNVTTVSVPAF